MTIQTITLITTKTHTFSKSRLAILILGSNALYISFTGNEWSAVS
jgi:hypothetical protein